MKVVALVSGGKDSCFNMMHCVVQGHEVVALANLKPPQQDEMDSYMFQTVGHHAIELYAEAMGLPLFRSTIKGTAVCQQAKYSKSEEDEVEDLYELLMKIKSTISFDGVSSGAILSNYQRVRVENVCSRLGLQSFAYLWQGNQDKLLSDMISSKLEAIIIKVAALGLNVEHLGKTLKEMQPHLRLMNAKYDLNVCGEGGEYETMTLDCPLFIKKIVIEEQETILHSDDAFAPVAYLSFKKMSLQDKPVDPNSSLLERMKCIELPGYNMPVEICASKSVKQDLESPNHRSKENGVVTGSRAAPQFSVSKTGQAFITELYCYSNGKSSLSESTKETLQQLVDLVRSQSFSLQEISVVHLYCANMDYFGDINAVYKTFFDIEPPARVCVQLPLPSNVYFKMEAILHDRSKYERQVLHVQSISFWAPANIGPYSQSVKLTNHECYFSGSIGMIPNTLQVTKSSIANEAYLALHHVNEVSKVVLPSRHITSDRYYGHVTCYVTSEQYLDTARNVFYNQDMFARNRYHMTMVCVPRLPKNANVEWHVVIKERKANATLNDENLDDDPVVDTSLDRDEEDEFTHIGKSVSFKAYSEEDVGRSIKGVISCNTDQCSDYLKVFFKQNLFQEDILRKQIWNILMAYKRQPSISLVPVCSVYPKENSITVASG